jgi:hypothetical protein
MNDGEKEAIKKYQYKSICWRLWSAARVAAMSGRPPSWPSGMKAPMARAEAIVRRRTDRIVKRTAS